jgi:hypothetical protein
MDTIRLKDRALVAVKLSCHNSTSFEMIRWLSSEYVKADPQNHCVPMLDAIRCPFESGKDCDVLIVMPLLLAFQWISSSRMSIRPIFSMT